METKEIINNEETENSPETQEKINNEETNNSPETQEVINNKETNNSSETQEVVNNEETENLSENQETQGKPTKGMKSFIAFFKKHKSLRRLLIIVLVIVTLIAFSAIKNSVNSYNDAEIISKAMVDENADFNEAIDSFSDTTYDSEVKAKQFYRLAKKALKLEKYDYAFTLFEKCVSNSETYKVKAVEKLFMVIYEIEDNTSFNSLAKRYIDIGGTFTEEHKSKIKNNLINSVDNLDLCRENLEMFKLAEIQVTDDVNKILYTVAHKCYTDKNYADAVIFYDAYTGNYETIKAEKLEAMYENALYVIFEKDYTKEGLEILSTDEMKNYKQAEGLRLYCRIINMAQGAYDYLYNDKYHSVEDEIIKNNLYFPDTYKFISRRITSDWYIKKGDTDTDEFELCRDVSVLYSAASKAGYTVRDTYDITRAWSVNLDGSDYLLAWKIWLNLNDKNMLKYARTGEFTVTKGTASF